MLPADLSPYDCVVLPVNGQLFDAGQKATFASYLASGGRLFALGDGSDQFSAANATMNDLAAALGSGLSLNNDSFDVVFHNTTDIVPSQFTQGVAVIRYAFVSTLTASGNGQVLVGTESGLPFVGAEEIGPGLFVLSGDSNVFSDESDGGYINQDNAVLVRNLCSPSPELMLTNLHASIDSFDLDKGLNDNLQHKVSDAEKKLGQGKDACPKLDGVMRTALDHAGKGELSFDETATLLDATNEIEILLGCVQADSPNPKAESDLVDLMSTIGGMGLSKGEEDGLTNKARDAAKQLADGHGDQACKKLAELANKIADDTDKKNGLTVAQAATLTTAVNQISSDLGC